MATGLDPRQLEALRTSLQLRARQLREEIRQSLLKSDSEQYQQIADAVHDLEDDSFADLMVDVNLAEIDRDLGELREVESAQARLADGTYGRCLQCGAPIGLDRLRAAPAATRCFECQSAHERTYAGPAAHTL